MIPLLVFLLIQWVSDSHHRGLLIVLTAVCCLGWYLPTQVALKAAHNVSYGGQLNDVFRDRSLLLGGFGKGSILNIVRVLLPIGFAFWMLLPSLVMNINREMGAVLLAWIIPGVSFFLFLYMADADYLTFCSGAFILAAALVANSRFAAMMLLVCFAWNTILFLFARPLPNGAVLSQLVDFYVIKYFHYGIIHQWTSTIGRHGSVAQ